MIWFATKNTERQCNTKVVQAKTNKDYVKPKFVLTKTKTPSKKQKKQVSITYKIMVLIFKVFETLFFKIKTI
jgi:hypothetical protein